MAQAKPSFLRSYGLELLLAVYLLASLLHFVHNAEFVQDYPNLPGWVTRSSVYATWWAITAGGAVGYVLLRLRRHVLGLALLIAYAVVGLDGLLHYVRAPLHAHTYGMNLTIWFEALSAAVLLSFLVIRAKKVAVR